MSTAEYKTMTTAEIREDFLSFFASKGCKRVASSSLVPDDPSLLLTNAGMNQFKQYYLGTKTMKEIGATSCQKCLRTNDIDNIGDARHLSFFEMLGNFSFGGYNKQQACAWALEFITGDEHLGLPIDRCYFTVYENDPEGRQIWLDLGVANDHISALGEDDNFWAAGPTGPCGPCSEVYFDMGESFGCGCEDCAPGCDCDRYLEFWNLVFTQFDRQEDGTLLDLPHQNIDTGMGLERISAIMQHQATNYEGDVLRTLIEVGEKLSEKKYGVDEKTDISLRILADHTRSVTFMIADGILPSNEGRGYVLRRLLRRAVFHARILGIEGPFIENYIKENQRLLGDVYPEIIENSALINSIVKSEEERFGSTLETGESYLEREIAKMDTQRVLDGEIAFKLHDTYGFPIDLTREICESHDLTVDIDKFTECMEAQKERARSQVKDTAWSNAKNVWVELSETIEPTNFVGYDNIEAKAKVVAIVINGKSTVLASKATNCEIVLDTTPFYAEMGGQIGDAGFMFEEIGAAARVADAQLREGGLISHICQVTDGIINVGDEIEVQVQRARRMAIARNHTATHLLDAALKNVLGDHVNQAGSLVTDDRLRFDFTHFEAVSKEDLDTIEYMVNMEIFAAKPVVAQEMSLEDAKASGAVALFGEKYGDTVRVVSCGDEEVPFSRELCGGVHAHNTSEVGQFKIISESSVGSNVRRIEALTSIGALQYVAEEEEILGSAASKLKCAPSEIDARIEALQAKNKELENKLKKALTGGASNVVADAIANAIDVDDYKCVIARVDGLAAGEMRSVWDSVRDKLGDACACVLASATPDGKVALIAAATDKAVKSGFVAGKIIKEIAPVVDGRGGGRPNMAQAGGSNTSAIDECLDAAKKIVLK